MEQLLAPPRFIAENAGMIRSIITWLALLWIPTLAAGEIPPYDLREGDIVFSSSKAGQGEAVIAATKSPYTHCGIVFSDGGKWMVLEAVQPVRVSPLEDFIRRGPRAFAAMRLKTTIPRDAYQKARQWAEKQIGRDYDGLFRWDDQRLYCSELVWKVYQHAGVELCKPRAFRDYDLQRPEVRKIIEQRYGGMDRLPLDEKVVAPSDLAASKLLIGVPLKKK